jgi:hypothetical protein
VRSELFAVEPYGDRWAVTSGDEVLAVSTSEDEAARLAQSAARILLSSMSPRRGAGPTAPAEPRSFTAERD